MPQPDVNKPRMRWRTGCLVLVLSALLMLAVAGPLGKLAIQRNLLSPPEISLAVGGLRLRAHTITFAPTCDMMRKDCAARGLPPRVYAVWSDIQWSGEQWPRHYLLFSMLLDQLPTVH